MPLNLKTLLFILPIGAFVFWLAARHTRQLVEQSEFRSWRNAWFVLQMAAFLLPGIWLFYTAVLVTSKLLLPRDQLGKFTGFVFLLGILPKLEITIPGFGLVNYLFDLQFPRVLSIFLLFPLFFYLQTTLPKSESSLRSGLDRLVVSFLILISVLDFRETTFTNGLRLAFLNFIDFFLPYYVASRIIRAPKDFDRVLLALLLSVSVSALIGLFETLKQWHLYNHLVQHLLDEVRIRTFDIRGGIVRAAAAFQSPIVLGYAVMIGLGTLFYLQNSIKTKWLTFLVFGGLLAALLATVSRGPWVGFAFLVLVFIWSGKDSLPKFAKLGFASLLSLPLLLLSPFGQKLIDFLPFIGEVRADTISYRQQLLEISWGVFKKNPVFGSPTYLEDPSLEVMRQGEDIIDVVNSYLQIALGYGAVGLILFVSIFLLCIYKLYRTSRYATHEANIQLLGRALTAIMVSIALVIFTVSSIDYVPWYYWTLLGISSAYIRMNSTAKHFGKALDSD